MNRFLNLLRQEKSRREKENKKYNWLLHARSKQTPPKGDWNIWLILAGRGFGKTRTGSETVRLWVRERLYNRIAFIGQNLNEIRKVMVEGESGILTISQKHERPIFKKSNHQLIWGNGAVANFYGADRFEKLRGPQFDCAWVDELAKFRYPKELLDQLMLTLRLGNHPRCIITTTPRPIPILRELIERDDVVITKGNTFENKDHLSATFIKQITKQYENTRLGAQELYAKMLDNNEGALWNPSIICYSKSKSVIWKRIVIGVDPATTQSETSDETGIIIVALSDKDEGYVLDDLSGRYKPFEWGQIIVNAYHSYKADRVIAEVNAGGDLVKSILHSIDKNVSYRSVRATRNKIVRAEPIAALYEQKRVFHIKPFLELEGQMCNYTQTESRSPDRLDALVWGLTDLFFGTFRKAHIWSC
ncbi:MAG: DNA-packaging protein [Alphaproteobacteria bacterium]